MEAKQEYKSLVGNISMMLLAQKINCDDFHKFVIELLQMGYGLTNDIPLWLLIEKAEKHNGIQCLIDKGFIKKVEPEVFYKVFDKFKSSMGNYTFTILCVDNPDIVQLVSTDSTKICVSGDAGRVRVMDIHRITADEFHRLAQFSGITKIS